MVLLRQALRVAVITDTKILRRTLHTTNGIDKPLPLWQKRWPMLSKANYTNEGSGDVVSTSERQQAVQSDNYQLVIVGTGWAGYEMFTECSKHLADIEKNVGGRDVDIVVVSMRNVRTERSFPLAFSKTNLICCLCSTSCTLHC